MRALLLFAAACSGATAPAHEPCTELDPDRLGWTEQQFTFEATPVAFADFDGDGQLDVIAADSFVIHALTASGNIQWKGDEDESADVVAVGAGNVDAGDIPDIVTVERSNIVVWPNRTMAAVSTATPLTTVGGAVADIDGDGRLDVVIATPTQIVVMHGVGDGTFVEVGELPSLGCSDDPVAPWRTCPVALADVTGDHHVDIVLATSVFAGHGDGTFDSTPVVFSTGPAAVRAVGDVDGDGIADVVTAIDGTVTPVGGSAVVATMRRGGNLDVAVPISITAPEPISTTGLAIADVDGDGHPDLVVGTDAGDNSFAAVLSGDRQRDVTVTGPLRALAAADLDHDGKADLVATTLTSVGFAATTCRDTAECTDDAACTSSVCANAACNAGLCEYVAIAAGTLAGDQTTCLAHLCDGGGGVKDVDTADGTPCGDNAQCFGGVCDVTQIDIVTNGGPVDARVLDMAGNEVGTCAGDCAMEVTPGRYTVEVASPWQIYDAAGCGFSIGTSSFCTVDVAGGIVPIHVDVFPEGQWFHAGDANEVFVAAAYDANGDLIVGSSARVAMFDRQGHLVWSIATPATSIVAGATAIYVLSGDQLTALDLTGAQQWTAPADVCSGDFAQCLALAPNGDIVFGGPSVMRWDATGKLLWSIPHDPSWVYNSVGVTFSDLTFILQAGSHGVTAARFSADGTRLPDRTDPDTIWLGSLQATLATGPQDGQIYVASVSNGVQEVRQYLASTNDAPLAVTSKTADRPVGVAEGATGAAAWVSQGVADPQFALGYVAYGLSFNGALLSQDDPVHGVDGEIGEGIHGMAVSPVDGSIAVVGTYAALRGDTTSFIDVSLHQF